MAATKMKSPFWIFQNNLLRVFRMIALVTAVQMSVLRFTFVASLAPPNTTTKDSTACSSRREVLTSIVSSASKRSCAISILVTVSLAQTARAAIDVSGLKVETPNATDVFLGGTYYPDDDLDREGVDGRISRMKYRIELASSNTASASSASGDFFGLYRFIKVKGTSTAISSSRDDYIEFPGAIFQCTGSSDRDRQGQQCVSIDFSAIGGPKDAKGFWDESEGGIRFFRDNKVWSKQ